jgi:anaerobic magnesium-protoporphyrin IX monomethyl ester cyclase
MKVMLIQTPWSESSAVEFKNIAKKYASYPPIGLMYLAAFVEQHGHRADIFDLEVTPLTFDELRDRIVRSGAGLIGITTSTPVFHIAQAYAKALRESLKLPIVVGGPHVTVLKDQALTEEFDFAVVKEGEHTLLELMNELETNREFANIKGLIYRKGRQVNVNPPRPFIENLDSLPFPDRHKIDIYKYAFEVPGKGHIPVATVELTRGCPFSCVFCSEALNTGKKVRTRSVENSISEMLEVRREFNISHFFMLDSTLTLKRKLIESFCCKLIDAKTDITFEGQTRANLIDEPLLTLMKKAGLVRLNFGLESSSNHVLSLMKKQVDPDSVREAFRLCKKLSISALCGVMMGNPGDTRKTILDTARFVRSIPEIRYAPMAIATPYPGTELFYMAKNGMHGLKLVETDFRKYSRYAGGVMEVDGMKPAELVRLQRKALIIMHMTPSKIIGLIQHFGLLDLLSMTLKMAKNEVVSMLCGSEPVMNSIENENTTLRNIGLIHDRHKKD